ncbi:MAG: YqeG family HAD IIIA-type phosphatase [Clostridia bacterium]|nr:YqeG family HAD IIIA-type phosphatase [Clostridia bacterium]
MTLQPDAYFARFTDITPDYLHSRGIEALLIDIDNTLAPYEEPDPRPETAAWFSALAEAGIRAALISNNNSARVERFNAALGLPAYPDAHKPLPRTARTALAALGVEPNRAASLGDQIFTDVTCARLCGMQAILVPPIRDKKTFFWRFKRTMEKPILAKWHKKHGEFTQTK